MSSSSESESESDVEEDDEGSQSESESSQEETDSGSELDDEEDDEDEEDEEDEDEDEAEELSEEEESLSDTDNSEDTLPSPPKPPLQKNPGPPRKPVQRDYSSSDEDDEDDGTHVDLNALEEEAIQMEAKMLNFSIFTKKRNLDPLEQKLFEETEHDKLAQVEALHAELEESNSMLDTLQDHFSAIKSKLEAEDNDDDDDDDHLLGDDDNDSQQGDNAVGDDKVREILEAAIQEHAGDIALAAAKGQLADSDSEEEHDTTAALPDFSAFRAEAEKTLKNKNKPTRKGTSHLVQLLHDNKSETKSNRPKVQRSRTLPDRPGEEHLFFDWRYFKKTGQMPPLLEATKSNENPANESTPPAAKVLDLLNNNNNNSDSDSESESGVLKGLVTNKESLQKEIDDKDQDDNTTFQPSRHTRSGKKDSSKKNRKLPSRSNTAPPGAMRRPGEEFFDWKKFAAEQRKGK